MLKSPPLVATLSDSMKMSPCSWGDIFTWPLRGDRIIGLRQLSFTGCSTTDLSCTMEVQLCDSSGNCLHFAPGSHSLLVSFVSKPTIPTTQVVTSQVAASNFTVTAQ